MNILQYTDEVELIYGLFQLSGPDQIANAVRFDLDAPKGLRRGRGLLNGR